MNIRKFEEQFGDRFPISVRNIRLQESNFALPQLSVWEKKWWIINIMRWRWILPKTLQRDWIKEVISNMIYEPSYLSLERALRYYDLIPEWVFMYTSCTTKKTQQFRTIIGVFDYRSISPRLMWWYDTKTIGEYNTIRIATPEKTICDYIYLHSEITGQEDYEEMRINKFIRKEIASNERLREYMRYYPKVTQYKIQLFLDYIG